ncbi:F0F1 ATP synthase subunit A [Luteibaculum oceani]|uniref:ATP synthase subunit a n=1 Tax=Luteibaculum oceani TaxID=1294296 RepID=A0A5C6VNR5_9FLAO|nr:F0F1 ATP synthase subunit A [Luteibaculum oceani]TXC85285.1 F0F1 ATP synthase subunit A [Luteibaculum oceani]
MLRRPVSFKILFSFLSLFVGLSAVSASSSTEGDHGSEEFNPKDMILHHIADAHEWHFWDVKDEEGNLHPVSMPLPVILYHNGNLDIFMSSEFHHGTTPVTKGNNTYVMNHGKIYIADENGELIPDGHGHYLNAKPLDLSITKNVASMWLSIILLILIMGTVARTYKKNGLVPRGFAGVIEPIVLFVRDEIARPNISGDKYKRFLPFLLTVFFFIWINNLLGLIPILAPNLTGNISVTLVLALFTLIITNVSGNKGYWGHILAPPVPIPMWVIMIPVELIGIFTKPFALMVRLFANITAGHILILSLVSLIFIFKSVYMSALSIPFMVFMNVLELLVAALQAYIFTLLSALFIGMATEEAHH